MKPQGFNAEEFADKTIDLWIGKITKLNINASIDTKNSFEYHVYKHSNGELSAIEFMFRYTMKFVDMGVGKGQTIAEVKSGFTKRRPKVWYSKVVAAQAGLLRYIIAKETGKKASTLIIEKITNYEHS